MHIRDKIAAQRRKGKWAGGVPILGYDVDRSNASPKLVINAEEAVMVRRIFSLYQELGSLLPVVNEVNKRGWQNKVWKTKKGLTRGGKAFDKCSIYSLLEELQTNRRQLERQLSRDHAEIGKLAVLNDPTGATSARIADLHVRITKCESDLSRVVAALVELERSVAEKAEIAESVLNFESIWEALNSREKSRLIRLMVSRIEFNAKDTSISVTFYPDAIRSLKVKRKDDAA